MKKICLAVVGFYLNLLASFAQTAPVQDSSQYKNRKLKREEINLISSYYHQDGDNSAVTGGNGTEKLTDLATIINVKFLKYDKKLRKHSLTFEAGIDYYTSASSDLIDLKANSSASSKDIRVYPSALWSVENEAKGTSFGLSTSFSLEYDYTSLGFGANFSKKSADNNREFGVKAQAYLDKVSLIPPIEFQTADQANGHEYPATARNSYSGSLSYSQVVNKKLQLVFLLDIAWQNGYLGLPFTGFTSMIII